ncbi:MAG: hypothetical protein R8G66_25870 [Cytophagales bacterium]|nr:hypothetical protein [Cytophagales bacterium]
MKKLIQSSSSSLIEKLTVEMNALISVLKHPTLRVSDGLKRRYFKRLDTIIEEIKNLKVVRAFEDRK